MIVIIILNEKIYILFNKKNNTLLFGLIKPYIILKIKLWIVFGMSKWFLSYKNSFECNTINNKCKDKYFIDNKNKNKNKKLIKICPEVYYSNDI